MMNIEQTIEQNFIDYAAFVAQRRAVPDARDSLKYTARQILHAQIREKLDCKHPFKKSQKSVAAAMSFSYVHGDSSAYQQLIHMGRPLVQRYFLEEIEGNGGTPIQSDGYASSRYTECRASELTSKLFETIDMSSLSLEDWQATYDEEGLFPLVLPSLGFYNICNGSFGSIGVGLISSIPQFNLREVNRAIIQLILDSKYNPEFYPDFASSAILLNPKTTITSLANGRGKSALLRAHIKLNEKEKYIDILDLPYGVYTNTVCKEMEKEMESGDCPISSFKDLSRRTVHIRVYGKNLKELETWLYKNTSIQKHFTINLTMLDKGKTPKLFTIKEALLAHIDHVRLIWRRALQFQLQQLKDRQEIIEGLLKAYSILDEVIATIKSSKGRADAIQLLVSQFGFTKPQAEAIVDLRLHRLSAIDIQALQDELDSNLNSQADIQETLNTKEKFDQQLIAKYEEVAAKFGDERRTEIYTGDEFESVPDGTKPSELFRLKWGEQGYISEPLGEDCIEKEIFSPSEKVYLVTNQLRGFMFKGEDFTFGEQLWIDFIKLKEKEKPLFIMSEKELKAAKRIVLIDIDKKKSFMDVSVVSTKASKRGCKLVNRIVDMVAVRFN